jgi:hypothetical protein
MWAAIPILRILPRGTVRATATSFFMFLPQMFSDQKLMVFQPSEIALRQNRMRNSIRFFAPFSFKYQGWASTWGCYEQSWIRITLALTGNISRSVSGFNSVWQSAIIYKNFLCLHGSDNCCGSSNSSVCPQSWYAQILFLLQSNIFCQICLQMKTKSLQKLVNVQFNLSIWR